MLSVLPTFETLDDVQHWAIDALLHEGASAYPRGLETRELLAAGFCLSDPRARKIGNPARGWSEALAVGEFAWHVSGSTEVAPIAYYAPRWRNFSQDGEHIRGSCYGSRIFSSDEGLASQWERLVNLLRDDPSTRRAVLTVMQTPIETLSASSIDVPCVSSCQFMLRNDRLHAVLTMRSNDVIWGLPYDVFLFTMIQEMLACELGAELGSYCHIAGSLHLYNQHEKLAERVLEAGLTRAAPMPRMSDLAGLSDFLEFEREMRTAGRSDISLSAYWRQLAETLVRHASKALEII